MLADEAVIEPSAFNLNPVSPLALLDFISSELIVNPPMLPTLELTVPLMIKVVPSNCKSGLDVPPSLNVPSFRLNSEPIVVLKLFDCILPVLILSPVMVVVLAGSKKYLTFWL